MKWRNRESERVRKRERERERERDRQTERERVKITYHSVGPRGVVESPKVPVGIWTCDVC